MTDKFRIVLRCHCPGVWKNQGLTVTEAAYEAGIAPELMEKLVELGLVYYQGRLSNPRISRGEVLRIQKMVRLRRDLNLNWVGAGLVVELLDEMESLKKELKRLKSWYGEE